jgi:TraY domain
VVRPGKKQLNVGLPNRIREELIEAAAKNGRALSKEVRVRLDQSIVDSKFDTATNDFARDVMWLARLVSTDAASWSTDEKRFEAFRIAIDTWLTDMAGRLNLQPQTNVDPESLGKAIAQAYGQMGFLKHKPGGDNMGDDDDE